MLPLLEQCHRCFRTKIFARAFGLIASFPECKPWPARCNHSRSSFIPRLYLNHLAPSCQEDCLHPSGKACASEQHQATPTRSFLKWGYPQIIHVNWIFPYKPSISGYPHIWKPPTDLVHTQGFSGFVICGTPGALTRPKP